MLVVLSVCTLVVALALCGLAIYYRLQLYMMRLRAEYWENQVKTDSLIRHQWLKQSQPH